jgi:hypothetical protein
LFLMSLFLYQFDLVKTFHKFFSLIRLFKS